MAVSHPGARPAHDPRWAELRDTQRQLSDRLTLQQTLRQHVA